MPKLDLVSAIEDRKRELLIDLLRQHPELTLGELQQLACGELGPTLRLITVADLRGSGKSESVPPAPAPRRDQTSHAPASKAPVPSAVRPAATADAARPDLNTRTVAGREAFDLKILEAVTAIGGPVSATQVQARVSGTSTQVRAGLNRLIEVGKLTWSGQARGTRYHLA
jgi:hypothetical protein